MDSRGGSELSSGMRCVRNLLRGAASIGWVQKGAERKEAEREEACEKDAPSAHVPHTDRYVSNRM